MTLVNNHKNRAVVVHPTSIIANGSCRVQRNEYRKIQAVVGPNYPGGPGEIIDAVAIANIDEPEIAVRVRQVMGDGALVAGAISMRSVFGESRPGPISPTADFIPGNF